MQTKRAPVLFIGHGSPMNAIADNDYTRTLAALAERFSPPRAILVISAHWQTEGTWITGMKEPRTIHDFYGFPQALFDVRYPAPGSPEIAAEIRAAIADPKIELDSEWGLDHGSWSVLKHLQPNADVPVLQLSMDGNRAPRFHFELGEKLRPLRERGIWILASGNIVHNLRTLKRESNAPPYEWVVEFDQWVRERLEKKDFKALIEEFLQTNAGRLSVPTLEHYLPLLYVLGAAEADDKLRFEFEEYQNASISMRSLSFSN